jgi:hypothetical protein
VHQIKVSVVKGMFGGWVFSARIIGTVFQATGNTQQEAIGNLVFQHGEKVGISVIKD